MKGIFAQLAQFLIDNLIAFQRRITKSSNNPNPNAFEDLTPVNNADEDGEYSEAILWALKNEDIKNIAITGPYGSGKSSVLRTFESQHPEYEYLNISLATFKDLKEATPADIEKQNTLIEKSILQQIFYKVKSKEIPYSRFHRIKNIKFFDYIYKSFFLVTWLALLAYIYKPTSKAFEMIMRNKPVNEYVYLALVAIAFVGSILVVKELFKLFGHSKLNKISFTTGELEFDEDAGASVLNKHLDEILYFFERTKYNVVVIEDLDRFGDAEIFTKLRELNTLINKSDQIGKHIVFIYAIKDDMFKDKSRTKFFDFIIPIIPIINGSNSGNVLLKKMSEVSLDEPISSDFISDITFYIDDMRMLKNIYNEFVIYKKKLSVVDGKPLSSDKLFGFIVYKNMYPSDFAALHKNEGMVAGVFDNKKSLAKSLSSNASKRISEIEQDISRITSEGLENIKELRSVYIITFVEMHQQATGVVFGNRQVNLSSLLQDNEFNQFKVQTNIYAAYQNGARTPTNISFAQIEANVDKKHAYSVREQLINAKTDNQLDQLKIELETLKENVQDIRSLSIKEIIDRIPDASPFEGNIEKEKLLIYLIRNGYIDELYHSFISYFYEGSLTKEDRDFILSVKNLESLDYTHPLTKVKEVIEKLSRIDFKRNQILNFDLLDYLINSQGEAEYLNLIFEQLSDGKKVSVDFIDRYLSREKHESLFVGGLFKKWKEGWKFLEIDSGYSTDKLDQYLVLIIKHVALEDMNGLNSDNLLSQYISMKEDFFRLLPQINSLEKVKRIIEALGVKFHYLEDPASNVSLYKYIYEKNYYRINEKMVELNINNINPNCLSDLDLKRANYTAIMNSSCEDMINYIHDNISEYIERVFLSLEDNTNESEPLVVSLLNNEDISNELKEGIIEKENAVIEDLAGINDKDLWEVLLKASKLKASWYNMLLYYMEEEALNKDIVSYLNQEKNYSALSEVVIEGFSEGSNALVDQLSNELVLCNDISIESYTELLNSIPSVYLDLKVEGLSEEKVIALIKSHILGLSGENVEYLKEHFSKQHILLIEENIGEYLEEVEMFALDGKDACLLLDSKKITNNQKAEVINSINLDLIYENKNLVKLLYQVLLSDVGEVEVAGDLMVQMIDQDNDLKQQLRLIVKYIDNLDDDYITMLLNNLENPYPEIATRKKRPSVKVNALNRDLLIKLEERGYISSFKEDGDSWRVFPKDSS